MKSCKILSWDEQSRIDYPVPTQISHLPAEKVLEDKMSLKKAEAKAAKRAVEKAQAAAQRVMEGADKTALLKEMTRQINMPVANPGRRGASGSSKPHNESRKKAKGAVNANLQSQHVSQKKLMTHSPDIMNQRLASYFRQLADPWSNQGIKCPVNYNPVPSFMTTSAHTTATLNNVKVAASACTQIVLFPGHGYGTTADVMDGVSYHASPQNIGGASIPIGPVMIGASNPAIGFYIPDTFGMAIGVDVSNSSTAGTLPITWDTPLPYVGQSGNGGHTRWKLLSMGIEILNTTPITNRGGQIVHVMPNSNVIATGLRTTDYAAQPTYTITDAPNDKPYKLSWIPRTEDLAYWHSETGTANASVCVPAIIVFLDAPTTAQTYSVEVVCNWELSGHNLAAVSGATLHQPADKNVVEPTISALNFTKQDASSALEVAKVVATHAGPWLVKNAPKVARAVSGIASMFLGGE